MIQIFRGRGPSVYAAVVALHVGVSIMAGFTATSTGCGSVAVVGHRGEPSRSPEETLPSFQQAISDGAKTIEMDVQFTSDGVPVLMHDLTVDRTTDGTGPVSGYSAAGIAKLDAGSWFGSSWSGTRVPTFASVLALAASKHVAVIAELKNPGTSAAQLSTFIAAINATSAPVLVESFYPALLEAMAAAQRSTPRALITSTPISPAQAAAYGQALIIDQHIVTSARVSGWHAAGLKVYAFTPDVVRDWHSLRDMKVDAVITDDTQAFYASCSRRSFTAPHHP